MNRKKPIWRWLLWLGGVLVGVPVVLFLIALGITLYRGQSPAAPVAAVPPPALPVVAPASVLGPLHTPALSGRAPGLLHFPPNALAIAPDAVLNFAFGRLPLPGEVRGIRVFGGQCQVRRAMQATVQGHIVQLTPQADFSPGEVVRVSGPGMGNRVRQFTVRASPGGHTFSGQQVVPVRAAPGFLHVGDLDGDGDPDFVTANIDDNNVSVRFNDGHGTYSGNGGLVFGVDAIMGLTAGDLDNDGYPDLVTWGVTSALARIWHNDGTGHFKQGWGVDMGSNDASAALGDVDGDGDLDLLFSSWAGQGAVQVRFNDGTGTFGGGSRVAVGSYPSAAALGDVDGDGDLDLLTANYGGIRQSVSVRLNDGRGTFSGTLDVTAGTYSEEVVLGDVDGDGDLDLLARDESHTAYLRLNDGRGTFRQRRAVYLGCMVEDIALSDIDGDGDLDLVGSVFPDNQGQSDRVSIWRNDGQGFFGDHNQNRQDIIITASCDSFALADVDGDGDLDLLAATHDGTVNIRVNE